MSRAPAGPLFALSLVAACDGPRPTVASASAPASSAAPRPAPPGKPDQPAKRPALDGLASAQAAATRVAANPGDASAYLALRRGVWSAVPFLRDQAAKGCEVLVGPETGSDDDVGALGRLDAARAAGDAARAKRALREVELSLAHATLEVTANPVDARTLGFGATRAAYDAGLVALGAGTCAPDELGAATADYLGLLDAAERAGAALARGAAPASLAALVRELRSGAREGAPLEGRARRARGTGALGAELRRLVEAAGARARLPYHPAAPSRGGGPLEPVSALTLPRVHPPRAIVDLEAAAKLGAALFRDPRLSARGDRSCLGCHDPALGWADGKQRPASLDPKVRLRHTPSLLYAPLSAALLWDGGVLTPDDQALGVIRAHAELGGDPEAVGAALAKTAEGRAGLAAAGAPGARGVALALAAYEARELAPGGSPLDRFARGDDGALDAEQLRGLDVFAGKGRCARCHAPPVFGASRPPDFLTPVFADVGLTKGPGSKEVEGDPGRGAKTGLARDRGRMKTPTVRGVDRSAPYFHNGAFPTLDSVVEFYDAGGGRGLGLVVANQDADVRKLSLTKEDKAALVVFLRVALSEPRRP